MNFLYSTFFQTLVIFFTAFFVIVVYFLSKRNEKREAAIILLDEIRSAENAVDEIRRNKTINELNAIMPVNSWVKHKHLFANELNQDEFALVSQFYNRCEYAEKYRCLLYDLLNESVLEKAKHLQVKLIDLMADDALNSTSLYQARKKFLIELADDEEWLFSAGRPVTNILDYIANIQFVTPTSSGEQLRKSSSVGLLQRFLSTR